MEVRKCNALIRHYLHIDPTLLEDEDWAKAVGEAMWINENIASVIPQ